MCGIIGYVGPREAKPLLLSGLRRLEYRGYDSAGVALREEQGLEYVRAVGNLQNLIEVAARPKPAAAVHGGHEVLPLREIGNQRQNTTSQRRNRVPQHMMEVDARLFPIALHRAFGHPRHGGNFPERKAAEELEVDDACQPGVGGGQFVERIAQRNQIGGVGVAALKTAQPDRSMDFTFVDDGKDKWGLGFLRTTRQVPGKRSAGSLSWGGINNTYFWIDPSRGVAGVILMQFLPFADTKALAIYDTFERGVYQLADAPPRSNR